MRTLLAACAALSLAACATSGGSARLAAGKAFLATEGAYDVAVQAAKATINSGLLTPQQIVTLKVDIDAAYQVNLAARNAYHNAMSSLPLQTARLQTATTALKADTPAVALP